MKKKFTEKELKSRKLNRIAIVLKGLWEEDNGGHCGLFDTMIDQDSIFSRNTKP